MVAAWGALEQFHYCAAHHDLYLACTSVFARLSHHSWTSGKLGFYVNNDGLPERVHKQVDGYLQLIIDLALIISLTVALQG